MNSRTFKLEKTNTEMSSECLTVRGDKIKLKALLNLASIFKKGANI